MVLWKEGEQPAKEIELEKGLLNERPACVGDENDEDFPIEESVNNGRPPGMAVSNYSADHKEDEDRGNGDPENHFNALFELVLGLSWRECSPDGIFGVTSGSEYGEERESGQDDVEPRISTREEEKETGGKDDDDSKFERNFLADGCENCFHKRKVFL
jgi:hypothetical protein